MARVKLTFEPQFHRYFEHDNQIGWTAALPQFGTVLSFVAEIGDEQRRIELEGGVILVVDLKHSGIYDIRTPNANAILPKTGC